MKARVDCISTEEQQAQSATHFGHHFVGGNPSLLRVPTRFFHVAEVSRAFPPPSQSPPTHMVQGVTPQRLRDDTALRGHVAMEMAWAVRGGRGALLVVPAPTQTTPRRLRLPRPGDGRGRLLLLLQPP